MRRGSIKPSKSTAFVQMLMGIVFTIIGCTFAIPMTGEGGVAWFGVLWTLAALGMVIVGAVNAFSDRGIPTEEFTYDEADKTSESRLRELEQLRGKALITAEEYARRRAEIVASI